MAFVFTRTVLQKLQHLCLCWLTACIFALRFRRLANCFRDALEHVLFTAAASSAQTEAFSFVAVGCNHLQLCLAFSYIARLQLGIAAWRRHTHAWQHLAI